MPKIAVESWDPEFGASFPGGELEPSEAKVDPDVEIPAKRWKPLPPGEGAHSGGVVFVDGVRRIDAIVWVTEPDGESRIGLCASYAAGSAVTEERAEIGVTRVERAVFSAAALEALATSAGTYEAVRDAGASASELSAAVQRRLRRLEREVAESLSEESPLVVIDGPLSAEHRLESAVGYVKTHRVSYLSAELNRVVHRLEPGERTPLFLTTTSWSRYSCYLRLPGPRTHPWAGVVRLELADTAPLETAIGIADRAAAALPRYASVPYKDPRAPQNLFPIGGLERALRRRLGDAALVHRTIRAAAARS